MLEGGSRRVGAPRRDIAQHDDLQPKCEGRTSTRGRTQFGLAGAPRGRRRIAHLVRANGGASLPTLRSCATPPCRGLRCGGPAPPPVCSLACRGTASARGSRSAVPALARRPGAPSPRPRARFRALQSAASDRSSADLRHRGCLRDPAFVRRRADVRLQGCRLCAHVPAARSPTTKARVCAGQPQYVMRRPSSGHLLCQMPMLRADFAGFDNMRGSQRSIRPASLSSLHLSMGCSRPRVVP